MYIFIIVPSMVNYLTSYKYHIIKSYKYYYNSLGSNSKAKILVLRIRRINLIKKHFALRSSFVNTSVIFEAGAHQPITGV